MVIVEIIVSSSKNIIELQSTLKKNILIGQVEQYLTLEFSHGVSGWSKNLRNSSSSTTIQVLLSLCNLSIEIKQIRILMLKHTFLFISERSFLKFIGNVKVRIKILKNHTVATFHSCVIQNDKESGLTIRNNY